MIFQNKNILITGASSGLGLCLTEHFNKKNANLICVGRSKLKIKKILRDLDNTKINFLSLDLTKDKNLKKMLGFIKKEKKKIDIIIHCMGGGFGKKDHLLDKKDFEFLMKINLGVSIEINKYIIENKLYRDLKIIHIGSVASIENVASVGYSTSKAALIGYVKTVSKHFLNKKIFISSILPGAFEYKGNSFERLKNRNFKEYSKFIKKRLPLGYIPKPDEMTTMIELMVSNKGKMFTGSSIILDYGESNSFRF